jgi:hypothetical protein
LSYHSIKPSKGCSQNYPKTRERSVAGGSKQDLCRLCILTDLRQIRMCLQHPLHRRRVRPCPTPPPCSPSVSFDSFGRSTASPVSPGSSRPSSAFVSAGTIEMCTISARQPPVCKTILGFDNVTFLLLGIAAQQNLRYQAQRKKRQQPRKSTESRSIGKTGTRLHGASIYSVEGKPLLKR